VDADRLLRILQELAAQPEPRTAVLCALSARVIDIDGAGLTLMAGEASGPLCASDAVSARVEDLQFTLGEGPCIDSHHRGAPVLEPDLAGAGVSRWATFAEQALAAGVAAVFAFPLRVGAVRLGAMTLYAGVAGSLGDGRFADALTMADVVTHEILVAQSSAPAGALARDLSGVSGYRAEVHQASGMVAVQLGVTVPDALVRIRAHAFVSGRPLTEVARDIIGRSLRLDP
jgi:hypothetical protein